MHLIWRLLIIAFIVTLAPSAHSHAAEAGVASKEDYYQCSMHPWIVSDKPGTCPICGMALTKTQSAGRKDQTLEGRASIQIDPARRQLIGVTTAEVQKRQLIYSIHAVGHVAYNPDAITALAEYREAYNAYRSARGNIGGQTKERAMKLMELAELKLRLAGISSDQFKVITNATVGGAGLYTTFNPQNIPLPEGHVWVDADLYESESELVATGQKVKMTAPTLPGLNFEGEVKTVDAVLNEFPRKVRVRIDVSNGERLKAGMATDLQIEVDLGVKLSVPEAAVLDSGEKKIVFVDSADGHISPKQVQLGDLADGYFEVLSGLEVGEKVISSANFLIDSESRLRAAAENFKKAETPMKEGESSTAHQH